MIIGICFLGWATIRGEVTGRNRQSTFPSMCPAGASCVVGPLRRWCCSTGSATVSGFARRLDRGDPAPIHPSRDPSHLPGDAGGRSSTNARFLPLLLPALRRRATEVTAAPVAQLAYPGRKTSVIPLGSDAEAV